SATNTCRETLGSWRRGCPCLVARLRRDRDLWNAPPIRVSAWRQHYRDYRRTALARKPRTRLRTFRGRPDRRATDRRTGLTGWRLVDWPDGSRYLRPDARHRLPRVRAMARHRSATCRADGCATYRGAAAWAPAHGACGASAGPW